ncbi:MAG: DUF1801 domain-containing protein [Parvularcula sp.]|jgi:hypothetical protein|nr:DUF1801 domain-containing protein [Parvularcula sp.]
MSKSEPKLLSGGNPQIPKGYGDKPVQDYIGAVPGWKQKVCRKIDGIVTDTVDGVLKAVKWNSPFYGTEEDHYFLSYHCFDRYVKVTFHKGEQLDPKPPGTSKHEQVRYLNVHEDDELGEQFRDWVRQASRIPGEKM